MVKINLFLGLGTTVVVGGAGTAVYFGIQSGTDEKEKKKEAKGKASASASETTTPTKTTETATPNTASS